MSSYGNPAQDFVEKTLDINELCIKHPAATFFVRVAGDSMVDAGIFPGDILVVDRSIRASHGDIVIAVLDGEFTVKELALHPKPALIPRNPGFSPITLSDESELEIFGVVTNSVRDMRSKQ